MTDKKRNWFARHKILTGVIAIFVILVIAVATSGTDDTDTTGRADTAGNPSQQEQERQTADNLSMGESVTMGSLTHTLHGVRWDEGDQFMRPDEGTRWLVADIELENGGGDSEAISTLLMWNLIDPENRTADIEIGAETRGSLDGELGANRALRGEIAYRVSAEHDTWELIFEPSVFGFGQAIYTIEAGDIN